MNHAGCRWRHEYKYLIDAKQEAVLKMMASGVLLPDPHVKKDGSYTVRSLYFDDFDDSCLSDNLSGTDPRSKFRIRYYNDDPQRLVLEKKIKKRGLCMKQSCKLLRQDYDRLVSGDAPDIRDDMPQLQKSLLNEVSRRKLCPKVIVTYERIPYVYSAGNVRITFDRNISSSYDIDGFIGGVYHKRPVFSAGSSIMEVKWDELLPLHIREVMQMPGLQWEAFSKYYLCRKAQY